MTLSCSCAEFDRGDHESWWEPGRPSIPPAGTRCCECNALLPSGVEHKTIWHGEVYDPGEIEPQPRPPWDVDADEMTDDEFDAVERAWDAYCAKYGWDSDTERFERFDTSYRCERCADLATALEGDESEGGMGFCMIAPGELTAAHEECVNEVQELAPGVVRREIIWSQNKDGVWHPRRKTAADRRREELDRRWRNAKSWVRYGWRHDLRFKVWFPAKVRVMHALGYEYRYERYDRDRKRSIYRWQRKPRRPPAWEREAMRGRDGG